RRCASRPRRGSLFSRNRPRGAPIPGSSAGQPGEAACCGVGLDAPRHGPETSPRRDTMRTTTHVRCLFGVATLACAGLLLAATPALAGAGDAIELRRYRDLLDPHRLDCPRGTNLVVEDEG